MMNVDSEQLAALSDAALAADEARAEAAEADKAFMAEVIDRNLNELAQRDQIIFDLQAQVAQLREALTRQADNMAFVLNHFDVFGQWYIKFRTELEEDRTALEEPDNG